MIFDTSEFPNTPLPLDAISWRAEGSLPDPLTVLRATLHIGTVLVNLYAFETDDDMNFLDPAWDAGTAWEFWAMDGPADRVEIEGRQYAIFACPYCS